MKAETEMAIKNIMAMDPEVNKNDIAHALDILRGQEHEKADAVMKRKDVIKLLRIHRRTLDYYLDKGYLDRIYGSGKRALGVSRESFIRFTRRRTPQQ